jgi:hypothetical protein
MNHSPQRELWSENVWLKGGGTEGAQSHCSCRTGKGEVIRAQSSLVWALEKGDPSDGRLEVVGVAWSWPGRKDGISGEWERAF